MTLTEFVAVFGHRFPITVSAMRTEIGRGRLTASMIGGSYYVTPASVKALFQCPVNPKARASTSEKDGSTPAAARRSRTAGSSETGRLKSAQAAALSVWGRQNDNSPPTSRRSGRSPLAEVIPLKS
ncbi:hypothetical protein D3C86_1562290 [compost metagenome]